MYMCYQMNINIYMYVLHFNNSNFYTSMSIMINQRKTYQKKYYGMYNIIGYIIHKFPKSLILQCFNMSFQIVFLTQME